MRKKYKTRIKYLLILLLIGFILYFGAGNEYLDKGLSILESRIKSDNVTELPVEDTQTSTISGKKISGKITKVSDGDTVILTDNNGKKRRIRLNGIDCPEIGQEYGAEARKYVEKIALGKYTSVEIVGKDQYKRILGILYVDGINVNEALLKDGLAWVYKYNKDPKYEQLAKQAQAIKLNIWSNPNAIDPYIWRKTEKRSK